MSFNEYFNEDVQNLIWKNTILIRDELCKYLHNVAENIIIWILCYCLICAALYVLSVKYKFRCNKLTNIKRAMFFTAHPDDECMFFGPTIINFIKQGIDVHIVCLSVGNYKGKGVPRQTELWNACTSLGVNQRNITLYMDTLLPDDPTSRWPTERVAELIAQHAAVYSTDAIITFDKEGVSHHPNHSSIFNAISYLILQGKYIPKGCKVYTLDSVNILRKYWSYLDLPLSFLLDKNRFVMTFQERNKIVKAMKEHKSQMLWFRHLYLLFSRFIVINTLKEVTILDVELDLQIYD